MERKSARLKSRHRKYKGYAAALLGTAILTGATLPGIPTLSKALAAENPTSPPMEQQQLNIMKKHGWHEHKYDWPSSDDNQGWSENGRVYYRSNQDAPNEYANHLAIPVQLIKSYAEQFGFDPDRDSFTLIHQSRHRATVEIINNNTGQRFKVNLERDHGDWEIIAIRGIGDMNFPATYHSVARS